MIRILFILFFFQPFLAGVAFAQAGETKNTSINTIAPLFETSSQLPIQKYFSIQLKGCVDADAGVISFDENIDRAFSEVDTYQKDLRRLEINLVGTLFTHLEYHFQIDFAKAREIKDNWIRWTGSPFLSRFRLGHIREPFSFEQLTSSSDLPFPEVSTPTSAFSPGRNIGVPYENVFFDERIGLFTGFFLNTGSFSNIGEAKNRISEDNGWSFVTRLTGIPWHKENGQEIVHLGLSYIYSTYQDKIRFSAFPESRLGDVKLIDTGSFSAEKENRLGIEAASAIGPVSISGEAYLSLVDAKEDLMFWGGYLSASGFLTGEHRAYDRTKGIFIGDKPKQNFRPLRNQWGAWEVATRFSYADLNDGFINGGKEVNWSTGLNWYYGPHVRILLSYIHARIRDRDTPPELHTGQTDIFQIRCQFRF